MNEETPEEIYTIVLTLEYGIRHNTYELLNDQPKRLPVNQILEPGNLECLYDYSAHSEQADNTLSVMLDEVEPRKFFINKLLVSFRYQTTFEYYTALKGNCKHWKNDPMNPIKLGDVLNKSFLTEEVSDISVYDYKPKGMVVGKALSINCQVVFNGFGQIKKQKTETAPKGDGMLTYIIHGTGRFEAENGDFKDEYMLFEYDENAEFINTTQDIPKEAKDRLMDVVQVYAGIGYALDATWGLFEDGADLFPELPERDVINYLAGQFSEIDRRYRMEAVSGRIGAKKPTSHTADDSVDAFMYAMGVHYGAKNQKL